MLEVIGYLIIIFQFICSSLQLQLDHMKQCVAIIYNGDIDKSKTDMELYGMKSQC